VGTTTARPDGEAGIIRYNTTTGTFEGHNASGWGDVTKVDFGPTGVGANAYATSVGAAANNWANTKLANTSGAVFNGDLIVSGNVTLDTTQHVRIWNPAANTLSFTTSSTERARVDTTGNLLIGRTTSTVGQNVKLDVNGAVNTSAILVNGTPFVTFPSGTKMLFAQTSAPTGWTKDTTHNNKALRVVSGTAGSGGSIGFTTAFTSQAVSGSVSVSGTVGSTTLSTSQIPSHTHTYTFPTSGTFGDNDSTAARVGGTTSTGAEGGGQSHNHSWSGTATLTGTAINLEVQYVDVIIATKD
jgi:hypothetical protein